MICCKKNKKVRPAFQAFLKQVVAHKYLFLFFIALSIAGAYLINRYTTPIYMVRTSLLVKDPGAGNNNVGSLLLSKEGGSDQESGLDKSQEIAIITSYPFIYRTIQALDFTVSYFREGGVSKHEIYGSLPFEVNFMDSTLIDRAEDARFKVRFSSNETFTLEDITEDDKKSKKQTFKVGQKININGCPIVVRTTPQFNKKNDINQNFEFYINNLKNLALEYKDEITINSDDETSIVVIDFNTTVPQKGLDFLNEYTKQYIKDKYEEKSRAASQALAFINEQINSVKGTLGSTESNLATFRANNTFTDPGAMAGRSLDAISQIEGEKASLALSEKYYSSLLNNLNNNQIDQLVAPSSIGVSDGTTENLIKQLGDLQMEKDSYAASGNSKNPLVQDIDLKINQVKSTLRQSVQGVFSSNRTKLNQLNARAGEYQAKVYNIPLAEKTFTDIKRVSDFNDNLYQFLMQKRVEAGILKASATMENKIVEPPFQSSVPLEPKKGRNYVFGFLIGLLIPLGIMRLRTSLYKKVTGKEEIENTTTIPVIGTIYRNLDSSPFVIGSGTRTAVSESFRMLRSNITHLTKNPSKKLILITSTNSGEGKSFTSINIAVSFALAKKKTILVNLDLRVPSSAYELLGSGADGVSSYLDGKTSLQSIIQVTSTPSLHYISTGELPINPAELLMEGKLETLFDYLRAHYDYIIVDTPPLGIVADPLIIANYSDLNVLIVREKYTLKESLFELEQMHREGKVKDVVMVINDVRLSKKGYSNAYYYKSNHK